MTDHHEKMLIRGMSLANGLLLNAGCDHRKVINEHQRMLAEAWGIDDGDPAHRLEFMQMAEEISETIAASKSRKDN